MRARSVPARSAAASLVIGLAVSGCDFSDEVEPSDAGIEIIANDAAGTACSMSWEEVAAGTHDVVVITEGSGARVVLRDPDGDVVVRQGDGPSSEKAGKALVPDEVAMVEGTYVATCRYPDGSSGEARLAVTR